MSDDIGTAIRHAFITCPDDRYANIADATHEVANCLGKVADSIYPFGMPVGDDGYGPVGCLVEAVMGMTRGLQEIASSISDLADAVRERE
jgi:hypothetical protein